MACNASPGLRCSGRLLQEEELTFGKVGTNFANLGSSDCRFLRHFGMILRLCVFRSNSDYMLLGIEIELTLSRIGV